MPVQGSESLCTQGRVFVGIGAEADADSVDFRENPGWLSFRETQSQRRDTGCGQALECMGEPVRACIQEMVIGTLEQIKTGLCQIGGAAVGDAVEGKAPGEMAGYERTLKVAAKQIRFTEKGLESGEELFCVRVQEIILKQQVSREKQLCFSLRVMGEGGGYRVIRVLKKTKQAIRQPLGIEASPAPETFAAVRGRQPEASARPVYGEGSRLNSKIGTHPQGLQAVSDTAEAKELLGEIPVFFRAQPKGR